MVVWANLSELKDLNYKYKIRFGDPNTTTDKDRPSLSHTTPKHTLSPLSIVAYIFHPKDPNSSPNIIHLHLFFHSINQIER
ncbi:hypothetical protein L1987_47525 [Smallanthus sonchifolius]|uniref:Uncharacterized protein n=1 Tax=Smallanthus sonchifolius TaxID=185202 RepID=A0ACB9G3T5_9ASTR|nr:hypothetical protein L1987_47525 [Smallanthus sonchifolius]